MGIEHWSDPPKPAFCQVIFARALSGKDAEDFGRFGADAEKGLAAHPTECSGGTLLLLCVRHQLNTEANFGDVYRREKDRRMFCEDVDIRSTEFALLDSNPQAGVNQEPHGLRSALSVLPLPLFAWLMAFTSASAVLSSSVR